MLVITGYRDQIFTTASGRKLSYDDVYRHVSNILSGLYSLGGQYDTAIIEELVHFSNIFKDYSYQGVPDVRVIVYKGFPAMAMKMCIRDRSRRIYSDCAQQRLDFCPRCSGRYQYRRRRHRVHSSERQALHDLCFGFLYSDD